MKRIIHDTDLINRLALAYALGTLRGRARTRFQYLALQHPSIRTTIAIWQNHLSSLVELAEPIDPPPIIWEKLSTHIGAKTDQQTQLKHTLDDWVRRLRTVWSSVALWRSASIACLVALVIAGLNWLETYHQLHTTENKYASIYNPPNVTRYVAVLHSNQIADTVVVIFDPPRRRLTVQQLGTYRVQEGRSLQLWALVPGGQPRSLGVLPDNKLSSLIANETELQDAASLAISLEPAGGVPGDRGPTGPILFSGPVWHQPL